MDMVSLVGDMTISCVDRAPPPPCPDPPRCFPAPPRPRPPSQTSESGSGSTFLLRVTFLGDHQSGDLFFRLVPLYNHKNRGYPQKTPCCLLLSLRGWLVAAFFGLAFLLLWVCPHWLVSRWSTFWTMSGSSRGEAAPS